MRHISDVIADHTPLVVELYVCPECRCVGKIPQGRGSNAFRGFCNGSAGEPHKRVKMTLRTFREVVDAAA